jgi:hypothetical protein
MCYDCADTAQRAELLTERTHTGYLGRDGRTITTWTGGLLARVISSNTQTRQFPGYHQVIYWRGIDIHGQRWYGRSGGNGMCTNMRRSGPKG